MKKYYYLALIPIVILIEFLWFNYIAEFLTMDSDFFVLLGVLLLCGLFAANIFLFSYIYKQFKSFKQ